jgi:hypothetical protein
MWADEAKSEEDEVIGAFALTKEESSISRVVKTELDVSIKVSGFSAPIQITPPRRKPAEDLPFNRSNLGVLGLGKSLSDASRGLIVAGGEMELFRFCSPAFISIGDKEKLLLTLFSLKPLYNPESGRIYTFRVGYEHIEKNDVPEYDRLHITRSCTCSVDDTLEELSKFRDKDFQTLKIDLDFDIDFSYIRETDVVFDDTPSVFRILDTRGAIYEVYGFLDEEKEIITDGIPSTVSGFLVNRIPENQQYITAYGHDAINNVMPTGEITVLYQTITVLTKPDPQAVEFLGYRPVSHILDWMSDYVNFNIVRDPLNNKVEISINNPQKTNERNISLFYTDIIGVDMEDVVYEALNIDKWFNVANGIKSIDNSNSLSDKIAVGSLDRSAKSVIDVNKIEYDIYNRFTEKDIYIGSTARNPRSLPFTVSKYDFPKTSTGLPYNSDTAEGIFIGFDDLCLSPLAEDVGQWVFRSRVGDTTLVPFGVYASESTSEGYAFEYEYVPLDHVFSGVITTDGEFSSVVRAHRSEDGSGCPSGLVCAAEYRYCGDGLLEAPEGGWRRLGETSSDLINLLIGGYEGEASNWMKHGAFDTAVSGGVYRMGSSAPGVESCKHEVSDGNFVYTRLPCYSGDYSATVSFKVANMDYKVANSQFGRFDGSISGNLVGLTPVHIYDGNLNIKISLAISDFGHSLILILEGETNEIVDISYFDWDNGLFNYITIIKDADSESVIIQSDYNILSKLSFDDFYRPEDKVCSLLSEPFFAVHLFDGSLIDIIDFHDNNSGHVMDIGLVEYSGRYEDGINSLESEDILINTDSKIEFSFKNRSEFADGYLDGYLDGYGYLSDQEYDVDEIYFTSDKLRFLFDSGESDSGNRMSVFKDGKGFMNFRVYDNLSLQKDEVHMYNIATNIKDFKAGEMHHIAASWRLNTLHEKDEMHLFVDGLEAPNIYKFGGPVSVKVNDKFSDVSKEVLQDFLVDGIEYCDTFTDGTILAGTSKFISESAGFSEGMIGRSVLILDSKIAQTYIGGEYIINSVSGNEVTFVSGNNLDIVVFDVSASDISFAFPPIAGLKGPVSTDLRNSSFAVFREPCDGSGEVELGGILYSVDNGQVNIISGANVIYPKYRANVDTRVIEFVGQGDDCKYSNMIDFSDLNVHIKTFGLKFANFNEIINLSSSSYYLLDKKEYDVNSGKSVILAHAVEPVALEDVSIKRIILPRMIPEVSNILEEDVFLAGFEIPLVSDDGSFMVSSQSGQVHKTNLGRHLTIKYDSDNTVFCARSEDGYGDAYGDDLSLLNAIRVWGDIVDGSEYEEFFVTGNGEFRGEKLFRSVSKVEGDIYLADPNYEPFVIEIVETNSVTVSDNDGEYAEVFRYNNGSFVLTAAGSNGFYPFELHPGGYYLNYPAYLKVNLPRVGDRAYIGCDLNQENQFGGTIDEFRVITEMSSDTRPTEGDTAGTRSVTEDFFNPNPHCNDDQTLLLTHFDDPIRLQARRLRQKEFLNTESNFKFKLDLEDRETLLGHINDKDMFEATMIRMGFDKEIAEAAYTECHYAQGGPVFNEARFIRSDKMIVSSNSVNDNFGMSAKFFDTAPLVINNRLSYFRRDMGTVEFWTSPLLDTIGDELERYYVDIYSITKKRVTSFSPNIIDLPTSAKEIVSVQLLQNTKEFSDFFSEDEMDKIFFDEVYRSEVTGRLTGGTGVEKDFAIGSRLSADGRRIFLAESLPGANIDVVVSYIPIDSSGDRISIYKNEQSQIVFSITSNGVVNKVCKDVDWKRNTWHRIMCTYRANSGSDSMRLFLDGEDCGHITYGDNGVTYGSGFVYGQTAKQPDASKQVSYNLSLNDDFRLISIGSDIFGKKSSLSRLDNIRFSRRMRDSVKDPSGNYIDPNYSSNTDTVMPVAKDDSTTLILNFEKDNTEDTYATVIDPAGGVFNFDIEVLDSFSKINEDDIEDLIVQLVNRLKPAHANALVLFPRESC